MSEDVEETRTEGDTVEDAIFDFVDGMLEHLDWDLDVEIQVDEPETVRVEVFGEDRDLMLQNRAEVLDVFQYLTNRVFGRRSDERRIVVDCEGFRARKEVELQEIAARVAERVRVSGEEEALGSMNPYERRIVHLAVEALDGVTSESEGDGVMKRVVIFPS